MKKLIPLFMLAALLVLTVPALAGNGDVEWAATKTIALTEQFHYTESVTFTGTGLFLFDGESWAKIQEQQELYSLTLSILPGEVGPGSTSKRASIDNSFDNGATGIANVNQSPGNLNNQGNEVAFSHGNNGTDNPAATNTFQGMYCEAEVVSVQYNGILFTPAQPLGTPGGRRAAAPNTLTTANQHTFDTINASFNGFTGIANVNESAGNLNNQGNAVAIAAGVIAEPGATPPKTGVVKAATDVILAQASAFNTVREGEPAPVGNEARDSISGSFNNSFGVSNVNQAAGSLNNQKNIVAISFTGATR